MISLRSAKVALFLAAAFVTTSFAANPPFSVFVDPKIDVGGNVTFALNVPSSGNDLFFHLSVPNQQSWFAFGIGKSMLDSPLMFVAYRSSTGKNVTVSPRLATGYSEPQHNPVKDVTVSVLAGTGVTSGKFGSININAKCENCRKWAGNALNTTSRQQPIIFTSYVGNSPIESNDLNYHIPPHITTNTHQFTMDMVQATGSGGVPVGPFPNSIGVNGAGSNGQDNSSHLARIIHALLMLGSFLLLFPLGVVWLRVLEKVWMHWINQLFASFLIAVAAVIGIVISIKQKISPSLTDPHQLIGLVAVALVLIQLMMGFIHHRIYKTKGTPTHFAKIHRYAGPAVILLGIVNGFVGFHFASNTKYEITYGLLILIVGLTMIGALLWKKRRQRRQKALTSTAAQNFNESYAPNQEIPLRDHAAPPSYGFGQGQSQGQAFGGQNQGYYAQPAGRRF